MIGDCDAPLCEIVEFIQGKSFRVKTSSREIQIFLYHQTPFLYKQEDYCISLHPYRALLSDISSDQPEGDEGYEVVKYHTCVSLFVVKSSLFFMTNRRRKKKYTEKGMEEFYVNNFLHESLLLLPIIILINLFCILKTLKLGAK